MKATLEQMQTALQNFANEFGFTVYVKHFEDKRKKSMFFIQNGSETISPLMDYNQSNCFLIGCLYSRKRLN